MLVEALKHLYFYTYRITYNVRSTTLIPKHKGSTLRGALGFALRKVACMERNVEQCVDCSLYKSCPYSLFWESPVQNSPKMDGRFNPPPHPYMINSLVENKTIFKAGNRLTFDLTLFGRANQYLFIVLQALRILEKTGIGRMRGKVKLVSVESIHPQQKNEILYSNGQSFLAAAPHRIDAQSIEPVKLNDEVTLKFETPFYIKEKGETVSIIKYNTLINRLLDRVSLLAVLYCKAPIEILESINNETKAQAEVKKSELSEVVWRRFSRSQQQPMTMGGLQGKISYKGDIAPYANLLNIGQYTNVGKRTTFGFGKYKIVVSV